MLKKILLALDGSLNAECALWWVLRYASLEKAQVVLFRAVDARADALAVQLEEARAYLQRMEKEINYAGLPTKMIVRQGKPAMAIVRTAMEERCDLILMTTRGGSKVRRWAIGGVTEQVLRLSPVPVLPIRSRTRAARHDQIRRVILPVDGSHLAEEARAWALELARRLRATLVFLHVAPAARSRGPAEDFDALRLRMVRDVQLLKTKGVRARLAVRTGDAAERILRYAGHDDLIVTTTHGAGGVKRWIFGSVAEKLIHEARIPVFVHKTPAQVDLKALKAS